MNLLKINNLTVITDDKQIINNLNLEIKSGEIHVLMGPNGSGKSTLAYTIAGNSSYLVTKGEIIFKDQNITEMQVHKRAKLGIFLLFQYPQEIPGLQIFIFLKEIYSAFNEKQISVSDFKILVNKCLNILNLDESFIYRNLNEGFSGGEKKKLEMIQLLILNPDFAIIDEIDSGLDIDALKVIANAIKFYRDNNPKSSIILITHYQRILQYILPNYVHIFNNGEIIKTGNFTLAEKIEKLGYENLSEL